MTKRVLVAAVLLFASGTVLAQTAADFVRTGDAKSAKYDLNGAIADYTKALDLKPDYIDAFRARALAKLIKGDPDGAIADSTKAIELQPDAPGSYTLRGSAKQEKGDIDAAIVDFSKAIELQPTLAGNYNVRGHSKLAKSDIDGALADFSKAIELQPDFADAYTYRGAAKRVKGDLQGALADFAKAIGIDPEYKAPYGFRAHLHYDQQAWKESLADYRKLAELDPIYDYARFGVWLAQARLGDKEAASKDLQAYLKTRHGKPEDWPAQVGAFLAGQLAEAAFLKAAASNDRRKNAEQLCEACFYAGTKRLLDGDKPAAQDYFEKCLATDVKSFSEYDSAAVELKLLKNAK
jgi:lipoprotein NlpI